MTFHQIVSVDRKNFDKETITSLQKHSSRPVKFFDIHPKNKEEIIRRIGDADGVLVTWETRIDKEILDSCPAIRYVGIIGKTPNVDMDEIRKRNIFLTTVEHYGHQATPEFIFAELLQLARGLGAYQWKELACQLYGKTIGIIGFGCIGQEVARLARGFGMDILYYSRTRRPEWEQNGVRYTDLPDLLGRSDIVTLHTPKDSHVMGEKEFSLMRKDAIFVNTCLPGAMDENAFIAWIRDNEQYAILDIVTGHELYEQVKGFPHVIFRSLVSGRTLESRAIVGKQVIENIERYVKNSLHTRETILRESSMLSR